MSLELAIYNLVAGEYFGQVFGIPNYDESFIAVKMSVRKPT